MRSLGPAATRMCTGRDAIMKARMLAVAKPKKAAMRSKMPREREIFMRRADASVPAEHEGLERQHQRLQPQNEGMYERTGVHRVKNYASEGAGVFCHDDVVVIGIGVGDAAAARRYIIDAAPVERLEEHQQRARPRHLLRVDELLATAELSGRDEVLDARDRHRDDGERLRHAGDLGDHARFHVLRLDLVEASLQSSPTGLLGD